MPIWGSASMRGSNRPRTRPIEIAASRSSPALRPNRWVSASSRPMDFTTSPASKLSWATRETSLRSSWVSWARGAITRWYQRFSTARIGKTTPATAARTGSTR